MSDISRGAAGCLLCFCLHSGTVAAVASPPIVADASGDHAITRVDASSPLRSESVFEAVNREHDLVSRLAGSSLRIAPMARAGRSWTVDIEVLAFGLAGETQPLAAPVVSTDGRRVIDRYGALTRTVVNSAAGLTQVFTIAEGPTGDRRKDAQVVRLGIVHPTTLASEIGKHGRSLRFVDESGAFALALSIVRAVDADGALVPARMAYSLPPRSLVRHLEVIVEGAGAAYPVEIALRATGLDDPSADEPPAISPLPIKKLGPSSGEEPNSTSAVLVAPPNDDCSGAEAIPGAGPFPYLTAITADITDATTGSDPAPMVGCPVGVPSPSRGIWYTFTPAASGAYTISSCADSPTGSTVDDTILDIYTSSDGTCPGVMTPIACDDDACVTENFQSVVTTNLTAGTPYFIVVHKWDNVAPTAGNTAVQLRVTLSNPPANDACVGASPLALNIPQAGTTLGATNDYSLSGTGCFSLPTPPAPVGQTALPGVGRDVVYSFTAAAAGNYSFRVRNATGGINPVLYVVDSCPPPSAIPTPPCLGAANRRATTAPVAEEVMCLPIAGGTTVYAFVDETALTGGGNFTIEVNDCLRETEPNDTPDSANDIAGVCGLEASTSTAANVDFYSLGPVTPGARIFAFADNTANNTGDHAMRVTNATDTFEFDDDDGDVVFGAGGFEPLVAGTDFAPGGTAYLRVNPFSATLLSEPYRLYHVEQPPAAAAVVEIEPNDPPNFNAAAANYFSGVTSTTDQDDYAFSAVAGDLIYVSADNDPDMDGIATNTTIGLFDPLGALVVQVNGSLAVSSTRTPVPGNLVATTPVAPGEALVYRAPISGTYQAAIIAFAAGGPGNYLLSISKNCATGGGGVGTVYTFPSIATIVMRPLPPFFPSSEPAIIRLRQDGPDTTVGHGQQVGDTIPGEILSLDLRGESPLLGPMTVKQSVTRDSLGQTRVVTPTQLDSFFDVFVDIDLDGIQLFNDQPIRVQGTHSTQPPQDTHMESPIQAHVLLYDVTDPPPGGAPRAEILYVDHYVDPRLPPGDDDRLNTRLQATLQLFPPLPPFNGTVNGGGGTIIRRQDPCAGCGPGGVDTIQTEMLQLNLTGNAPLLGPFQIQLNHDPGYPPTLGQIAQQTPGVAYPANAFFDVFFDVTTQFGRLVTRPGPPDGAHVEASNALGNPLGTIPPGAGESLRQPPGQQTMLYQPSDLATPVGLIRDIVHSIDVPKTPGPPPPPGKDCFDSRIIARITLFPPFHPVGCSEDLILNGPFKVERSSATDPGNGRDLIRTIMACYQFAGSSTGAGCGLGSLLAHPSETTPSMGQVQSMAPAETFPADSFFDIFTQIETGIGPLHTNDPTRMQTTIRTLPPDAGEIYFGPGVSIPLYNAGNVQVGTLEVISHELISAIVCPCVCEPKIRWRNNKTDLDVGIPQGGAGVEYDVVRGIIGPPPPPDWPFSFGSSTPVGLPDGPPAIGYPTIPAPGTLHWLLSRDGAFSQTNGTWNSCPQTDQTGDRDLQVPP